MQSRSETVPGAHAAQHAYAFLSQPPPQDIYSSQEAATQAHYARRRSLAAISNWASSVQPGAPVPISPSTKAKFAESSSSHGVNHEMRPSRRHSVKPTPPPPMEYLPDSPSSSDQSDSPAAKTNFKADLQPAGYTSVYVTLPNTPTAEHTPDGRVVPPMPASAAPTSSASKGKGFARLRSLAMKPSSSSSTSASTSAKDKKDKKSKYAEARPAQLATDLALAQLLGGGTLEHHMKQAAEHDARRAGTARRDKRTGQLVGVDAPYRDADGRVWRDEAERWEHRGLLDGSDAARRRDGEDSEWVQFNGAARPPRRRSEVPPVREESSSPTSSVENYERPRHGGKTKRRPEPLDLAPSRPAYSVDAADARREFLESSFEPAAEVVPSAKRSALKPAMLNVKSMFKSSGKKGAQ
jgi:hypothetical protein